MDRERSTVKIETEEEKTERVSKGHERGKKKVAITPAQKNKRSLTTNGAINFSDNFLL